MMVEEKNNFSVGLSKHHIIKVYEEPQQWIQLSR